MDAKFKRVLVLDLPRSEWRTKGMDYWAFEFNMPSVRGHLGDHQRDKGTKGKHRHWIMSREYCHRCGGPGVAARASVRSHSKYRVKETRT